MSARQFADLYHEEATAEGHPLTEAQYRNLMGEEYQKYKQWWATHAGLVETHDIPTGTERASANDPDYQQGVWVRAPDGGYEWAPRTAFGEGAGMWGRLGFFGAGAASESDAEFDQYGRCVANCYDSSAPFQWNWRAGWSPAEFSTRGEFIGEGDNNP